MYPANDYRFLPHLKLNNVPQHETEQLSKHHNKDKND
jgi:hypothetical protein